MSPSEADLRAALRTGEAQTGDVDADAIIAGARAHLAHRRVRLMSVAGAAAAVAGIAVAGSLVFSGGHGGSQSESERGGTTYGAVNAAAGGGKPAGADALRRTAAATKAQPSATAPAVAGGSAVGVTACPAAPPVYAAASTAAGPAASSVQLFSKPVDSLVVCAYPPATITRAGTTGEVRLSGTQARQFTLSLTPSTTPALGGECSTIAVEAGQKFAVLGLAADGSRAGTVLVRVDSGCDYTVASRHGSFTWQPSSYVRGVLVQLGGAATVTATPGIVTGSPIHT